MTTHRTPSESSHYAWQADSLFINCSVQPKSNDTRIVGVVAGRVKIRLNAAPTDGKANGQLIKLLAKQFAVKQAAITIVSGATSRHKRVCVEDPQKIPPQLEVLQR